jgi:hypothetical protein
MNIWTYQRETKQAGGGENYTGIFISCKLYSSTNVTVWNKLQYTRWTIEVAEMGK